MSKDGDLSNTIDFLRNLGLARYVHVVGELTRPGGTRSEELMPLNECGRSIIDESPRVSQCRQNN